MKLSLINILILLSAVFTQLYAQTSSLHSEAPLNLLKNFSTKSSLTTEERNQALGAMLQLMNEARQNPNYRRASGCKTALALPSNLTPLVFDDRLTKTAQEQADYQASIRKVTHDNRNYRDNNGDGGYGARIDKYLLNIAVPEACGGSEQLADQPIRWMKSETHYRPTWSLELPMNAVGFGIAKGSDNVWYTVAVWANLPSPSSSLTITPITQGNTTNKPAANQLVSIFDDCSFGGRSKQIGVGAYDMEQLIEWIGNDAMSSLKIPKGLTVTLYEGIGYNGRSIVLTSDTPCLVDNKFNDTVSSMKVALSN